ncbi:10706_t:CDS:10 [Entrophospora sp. SA101]|nr:10706_t:CDS:10 [Entrophospora sp. SA101]
MAGVIKGSEIELTVYRLTTLKPTALTTAPSLDLVAYAAGAVVTLYNHKKNKQIGFLYASSATLPNPQAANQSNNSAPSSWSAAFQNRHTIAGDVMASPLGTGTSLGVIDPQSSISGNSSNSKKIPVNNKAKPISCLAFSPDGVYLAVGESGHQPRILIWEVQTKTLINELKGHKFGVLALSFSPNMKFIVSLGFQHDGYLNLWNWKTGVKIACNKVTTKVHTLAFNRTGSYIVTAGLRHVKFWYLDPNGNLPKKSAGQSIQKSLVQVLDGRSGILGDLRDSNFVDAVCCKKSDNTYFVTSNGLLCMFTEGRLMDKWVNLQAKGAFSIVASEQYVICACTDGVIRLFEPMTLKYLGTLPKPHPLGVDLTLQTGSTYNSTGGPNDIYPDTTAIKLDDETGKLSCIYSDRSFFIWDIKDIKKIGKYRSFLSHCDTIWGVEMIPNNEDSSTSEKSTSSRLPDNTFVTYSSDSTIRFWNLDQNSNSSSSNANIYVDPNGTYQMCATLGAKNDDSESSSSTDNHQPVISDGGVRTLRISPDGKLMASGDRNGNLRVHNLDDFQQMTYQEAHDAEILAIEFTDGKLPESPYLIATASRDRILHIFDINSNFQLIQTLDDHSSSITAIKFTNDGGRLISCGADKSIIFRSKQNTSDFPYYATYHNISGRATVFDMDIDVSNRYIATVSGERRLNVYHIDTGKNVRSYKSDTPDEVNVQDQGSLLRISLDPGGVCAVTGGSDKSVRLFDFSNGTILGKVLGHSELITCVKFTSDCERVISTSADGCIFVWKISDELVNKMKQKWLDRSNCTGTNSGRSFSPVMHSSPPLPSSSSSSSSSATTSAPSIIHPRTTVPALRPNTLFAENPSSSAASTSTSSLVPQQSNHEDSNSQEPNFIVRKSPLKTTKSYKISSSTATSGKSNSNQQISFANSSPPNSPPSQGSPSTTRRESWKLGLPNKRLPLLPKTVKKSKSYGRIRHDSFTSSPSPSIGAGVNNKIPVITVNKNKMVSLDDSVITLSSPVSNINNNQRHQPVVANEDESDYEDDEEITSPIDDSSANEDTETIFIELNEDEEEDYDIMADNTSSSSHQNNKRSRRNSFVGDLKVVEINNNNDVELYLQTPVKSEFPSAITAGDSHDETTTPSDNSRKRESFTTKFYSGGHRMSRGSSYKNNSMIEALSTLIMDKENSTIEEDQDDKNDSVKKALEALERKTTEAVGKEYVSRTQPEVELNEQSNNNNILQSTTTTTTNNDNDNDDDDKTISIPAIMLPEDSNISNESKKKNQNTSNNNNTSYICSSNGFKSLESKGEGLGIVVDVSKDSTGQDPDAPISKHNTNSSTISEVNEEIKNESMAKLISESLKGMINDIHQSLNDINDNSIGNNQRYINNISTNNNNINNDEGDAESNHSYTTALTTHKKYSDLLMKMVKEKMEEKTTNNDSIPKTGINGNISSNDSAITTNFSSSSSSSINTVILESKGNTTCCDILTLEKVKI